MTTIACKDGKMVGDGRMTLGGATLISDSMVKVKNIHGILVGGAGSATSILAFFEWFEDRMVSEFARNDYPTVDVRIPEDMVEEDFTAIVYSPIDGIFTYYGTKSVMQMPNDVTYYAIGSGMDHALSAMDVGATAEEAVIAATKRDVCSGGLITVVEFDEEAQEVTKESLESMTKEEIIEKFFFPKEDEGSEQDEPLKEYEFPSEEIAQLLEDNISRDNATVVEDGSYVVFKGDALYLPYLNVHASGVIEDDEGSFTTFVDLDVDKAYFYEVAKVLGVKHAHNISQEKLAHRLDEKVTEIVQEMNK